MGIIRCEIRFQMIRLLNVLTNWFPAWVLGLCAAALVRPAWFTWFSGQSIVVGLAVIMLGMGITLSVEDFRQVLTMPRAVAVGVLCQYSIMPLLGFGLARLFQLETSLAVGLILVACCPGGTASNVVAYIARANVALSVLMTMCSTFAAVFMTPMLTRWLAGTYVPVDAWALLLDTVKVVLVPVLAGLALHHLSPRAVKVILPIAPLVAVITIALICASIVGQRAADIKASAGSLLGAVFLLHAGGFGLGYLFARLLGYDELIRRTISTEVGMQNSGLAVVLSRNFPDLPAAATPGAISAVMHSLIGSALAAFWRRRLPDLPSEKKDSV
jgi:BASS family bile acid:Na+ symporter